MAKRSAGGSACVFVRGFDFGTTDEQLESHMCSVGTIENVKWVSKGSAEVTYGSPVAAAAAVEQLQGTTIPGNSRFIDVIARDGDQPTKVFRSGGKGQMGGSFGQALGMTAFGGGGRVIVRGFDFGTSEEQLIAHMSQVGNVQNVRFVSKGSAEVMYTSPRQASAAFQQLQSTTIDGNSRYIDVMLKDDVGGQVFDGFQGGGKGQGGGFMQALHAAPWQSAMSGGSFGKGVSGKGKRKGGDHKDEDPPGSGRVFVRGFDFGTTDEQFEAHMGAVGEIFSVHWVTKGSAVVVYKTMASAVMASQELTTSTIPGNTRYIDVILKER